MIFTNIFSAKCNMDSIVLIFVFAVLFTFTRAAEDKVEICDGFLKNKQIAQRLSSASAVSTPCPCDESTISLEGSFKKLDSCYQEWFFDEHGLKQMCCYSDKGRLLVDPPFGGYLSLSPSLQNISEAHAACCSEKSKKCALFYEINPSDNCSRYVPPEIVKSWGDPTITTLDKFQYDFNGHGEYNFLSTDGVEIQARTDYVTPGKYDATMFTAFVIYIASSGDRYEFHFDSINNIINVYKHGTHICTSSSAHRPVLCAPPPDTMPCMILTGNNKVNVIGCVNKFSKQVQFSAEGFMSIAITNPVINGDLNFFGLAEPRRNGTLALRNGTVVSDNSSASSLFDFGESWALQNESESRFNYTIIGKNYSFYNSNHTQPRFLEELVGNLTALFPDAANEDIKKYNATCRNYWNNEPNKQCLLTIARTGNYSFGVATMEAVNQSRLKWEMTHNHSPTFREEMPDRLKVILKGSGRSYTINLTNYVNDTDSDETFRFTVESSITDYEIDKSGEFVWTFSDSLRNLTSLDIKFNVYDKFNFSDSHTLIVDFCGCEHGLEECDFSVENNETGVVAKCKCNKYYNGDYCEQSVDPCSVTKCYKNQCNSSVAIGEDPCDPCPKGYDGNGRTCTDLNECASTYNGTDKCEQNCTNTDGGFRCGCKPGYILNVDQYTCNDINECIEMKLNCNSSKELCVNTVGSAHCACKLGYIRMNGQCENHQTIEDNHPPSFRDRMPDKLRVVLKGSNGSYAINLTNYVNDTDSDESFRFTVETSITGYEFNESGELVWTFDETLRNLTSLDIIFHVYDKFNSSASHKLSVNFCGCEHGLSECDFPDEYNDKGVVAKCKCSKFYSGEYCEQSVDPCSVTKCYLDHCNSSVEIGEDPCDPCPEGYDGDGRICSDVNECAPAYNGSDKCEQNCTNTIGSFTCGCKPGYTLNVDQYTCNDIDECKEMKLNCSSSKELCVNTIGSAHCACKPGNILKKGHCENIEGTHQYAGSMNFSIKTVTVSMSVSEVDTLENREAINEMMHKWFSGTNGYVAVGVNKLNILTPSRRKRATGAESKLVADFIVYRKNDTGEKSNDVAIQDRFEKYKSDHASVETVITVKGERIPLHLAEDKVEICDGFLKDKQIAQRLSSAGAVSTPCPCDESTISLDGSFKKLDRCYQEWFFDEHGLKQMCCYSDKGKLLVDPPFGGYLSLSPSSQNISEAHAACCSEKSKKCALFYEINPSDNCSRYVPHEIVKSWGDPTITTLDKFQYDFNGHGEYNFLSTDGVEIQARTGYVTPGKYDATMFTAFVIHIASSGDRYEFHFDSINNTINVYKHGTHICTSSSAHRPVPCAPPPDTMPCMILTGNNKVNVIGCVNKFSKQVQFSAEGFMSIAITNPVINGDLNFFGLAEPRRNGTLALRNGTVVSDNSSASSLFDFGESWALQSESESRFNYNITGNNYSFYNSNHTQPRFLEELVGNLTALFPDAANEDIKKYNATCRNYWNNEPNKQCLLTIARTGNYSFGVATMEAVNQSRLKWELTHNHSPTFREEMPDRLKVILKGSNHSYTIDLIDYVNDTDSDETFRFTVESSITNYEIDKSGEFVWTFSDSLRNLTSLDIKFNVYDKFNFSDSHTLIVDFCGCEHGIEECDFSDENNNTGVFAKCKCSKYYNGDYCEQSVDPCSVTKCYMDQCNSFVAIGEDPCDPCPKGYDGNGRTCTDVNECASTYNGSDKCEQNCTNTDGGFTCGCKPGYTLNVDQYTCNDINECIEMKLNCNSSKELCVNTVGSAHCACKLGYIRMNGQCENNQTIEDNHPPSFRDRMPDKLRVVLKGSNGSYAINLTNYVNDTDSDESFRFTVKTSITGYEFNESGELVWTFDETLRNLTSLDIIFHVYDKFNSSASHKLSVNFCGCEHGLSECDFPDEYNDTGVVAKCKCSKFYSGEYCEQSVDPCSVTKCYLDHCNSSVEIGEDPCDPCPDGYDGDGRICSDVNECAPAYNDSDKCEQNCTNTIGSFTCGCKPGYTLNVDQYTCNDIDECKEMKLNCSSSKELCVNTVGSAHCACKPGNILKKGHCENIEGTHQYAGSMNFSIKTVTVSMSVSEVDTLENREAINEMMHKWFSGTNGYVAVGVNKLNILTPSRRKRATGAESRLVADFIVYRKNDTGEKSNDVAIQDRFEKYKSDHASVETVITVNGERIPLHLAEDKVEICDEFLKDKQIAYRLSSAGAVSTPCPCDETTISLDSSFKKLDRCYQEWFFDEHGLKQMCCYSDKGRLLTGPPFGGYLSLSSSSQNISEAHTACCSEKSKKCALFYEINPSDNCSRYVPHEIVKSWGDPTITTLDKFQYDFNGHGEYNFLSTDGVEIQARTGYVTPGKYDATMFTAFVIHIASSGDRYEFHFDSINNIINVYKHGTHICTSSSAHRPVPCATPPDTMPCMILTGNNKVNVIGCVNKFSKQVQFSAEGFMSIAITNPVINGDLNFFGLAEPRRNGTLALRNGTVVSDNSSASSLFDFGESWALQDESESRFNYTITDKNYSFYNSNHTRPRFLEELVGNLAALFPNTSTADIDMYNATCRNYWNNEPNKQCLLIIARTGNYSFGVATMKTVNETRLKWERTHNHPPSFREEMPNKMRVVLKDSKSSYTINLTNYVNDTDSDETFRFTVESSITDYEIDQSGELVLTFSDSLRNLTSLDIKFNVYDKFNFSDSHTLIVDFCGCEHGLSECDFSGENNNTGVVAKCKCSKYYNGDYCEQPVDPCSVTKCYKDRCNSLVAIGEDPCDPCPRGYDGDGRTCTDVNECASTYNGSDKCEQNCTNNIGSFICGCKLGYTLKADNHSCDDIDECTENKLKCNGSKELCVNTIGSAHCACEPGSIRKEDLCETIEGTNQYAGSMNFSISTVMVSVSVSEVNTLQNREAINEEMHKWFNGIKGFVAVEVYQLQIVTSSRRKRATGVESSKVAADFIVYRNNTTGAESIGVAIEESYDKYKTDNRNIEIQITVNGASISLRPGVLSVQLSSAFGMCNITGRTDCDTKTTTCKNIDGGFKCPCLSGYGIGTNMTSCVDIDECKLYNKTKTLEQKCSSGTCKNEIGNWTCECPSELLLQSFADANGVSYRCQGNYSYVGNISMLTIASNKDVKDAIDAYMMKSYRNESFEFKIHTVPISNLFVDTTILTFEQHNYTNGSTVLTSMFNLRMGEAIDVQRVIDVLTKAVNANPTFSAQGFNMTILSAHIFTDEENILCDLLNDSDCDLSTTSCQQGNGSTSCECLVGHERINNVSCKAKDCRMPTNPLNGLVTLENKATIYNSLATFGCDTGYHLNGNRSSICTSSGTWSSVPSCLLWDCGSLTTPGNGSVNVSNTTYGSTANFSCDKGFYLTDGEGFSECDSNGTWSSTPTCVIYDCGNLTDPNYGKVEIAGKTTTYMSTAKFSCNVGYYLSEGNGTSSCDSNGTWTSIPTCKIHDCGQLKIQDSIVNLPGNKTTYDSVANISCPVGYHLFGDGQSECNSTGQWSGETNCTIIDCGSLSDPNNGSVEFSNTTYGSNATFSCETGYKLINGDKYATCGSNGNWTSLPICDIFDCGPLNITSNGQVYLTDNTTIYNSTATFVCDTGYNLTTDNDSICNSSGEWSHRPQCQIKDCGQLEVENGIISYSGNKTTYESIANISCADGYNLYGTSQSKCDSTGTWSGETNCTITDCGKPGVPDKGRVVNEKDTTTYKARVEYGCDVGYYISGGHNFSECESDGSWTALPNCTIYDCGPLNITSNGQVYLTDNATTYNSTATFACDTGYGLTTDNDSICNSSGEWSNRPQCHLIDCGDLIVEGGNVYLNDSRTTKDARASITCDEGHNIDGKKYSICNATGQWSNAPTCTKIDCGILTAPNHGRVTIANNITTLDSTADFTCDDGYYIQGNSFSQCKPNGNWSNLPSCTIRDCGPLIITEHGHASVNTTTFKSSATFVCDLGYKLTTGNNSQCNSTGKWTHKPECLIRDCSDPTVANGSFVLHEGETTYGSTANFKCNTGYDVIGNVTAKCNELGRWTTLPSCHIKDCHGPPRPHNGDVELWNGTTTYGSNATFTCNDGFKLKGTAQSTCDSSGNWTTPTCEIKDCGDINITSDGSANYTSTTYNSTATFTCDIGYTLDSENSSTCNSSGLWSNEPDCIIQDCKLPDLQNGAFTLDSKNSTTYESSASFECDEGYHLNGTTSATCDWEGHWTPFPTCVIKVCGNPPKPDNGNFTLTNDTTTFGSTAIFTCNEGYSLTNESQSVCDSDGNWTNTPSCKIKDCGDINIASNGYANYTSTTFNSTATFTCDIGYKLSTENTSTCNSSGLWTNEPDCMIQDCQLPVLRNGSFTLDINNLTTYESAANFTCNEGYDLNGNHSAKCDWEGQWTSLPTCVIKDCQDPSAPANGNVTLWTNTTTFESKAIFTCNQGYNLTKSSQSVCGPDGNWTDVPSCKIVDCGDIDIASNGYANYTSTTFNSTATFTCDIGYKLSTEEKNSTCNSSGLWTHEPDCMIQDCQLPALRNGEFTLDLKNSTTYGSSANFTCNAGYDLNGTKSSKCDRQGHWTSLPTCVIKNCTNPVQPNNGRVTLTNHTTTFGSTAIFTCNEGYNLMNESHSICDSNGYWTNIPYCRIVDCRYPTAPYHGRMTISHNETTFRAIANLHCDEGYRTKGNTYSQCNPDGNWSSLSPCILRDCGPLNIPQHGRAFANNTTFNSSATFECDLGYRLNTDNYSQCSSDGYWSNEPLCIIKDCLSPDVPHGSFELNEGTTTYGSTATFDCDAGYDLQGNASAICDENGTWQSSSSCVIKDCLAPHPPDNGNVHLWNETTTYGSNVTFTCNDGFELSDNQQSTCDSSGNWTTPFPTCEIKDCGDIDKPSNGSAIYSNTTFYSTATFACTIGYKLNSENISTCNSSGFWTNEPDCIIQDCENLEDPENGLVFLENDTTTYMSIARYECNTGYELSTNVTSRCESSGNWSTISTCIIKDCGTWINYATNMNVTYVTNDTHYGSTARAECSPGFHLAGSEKLQMVAVCTEHKTWSKKEPTCVPAACEEFKETTDGLNIKYAGSYNEKDQMYAVNTNATFDCLKGFNLNGVGKVSCLPSGNWNGDRPSCKKVVSTVSDCPYDKRDDIEWPSSKPGILIVKKCQNEDYEGSITRKCLISGEWEKMIDTCVRKAITSLTDEVEDLKNTTVPPKTITNILNRIESITSVSTEADGSLLKGAEIVKVTSILSDIVTITENHTVTQNQSETFLKTASNVLDSSNSKSFTTVPTTQDKTSPEEEAAVQVLDVVSRYTDNVVKSLNETENRTTVTIPSKNLVMHVRIISKKVDLEFPTNDDIIKANVTSTVSISKDSLPEKSNFSTVIYKDLSGIMPTGDKSNKINSEVMSIKIGGWESVKDFKVIMNFSHSGSKSARIPHCSFWDERSNDWNTTGCTLDISASNDNQSVCQCNHLTNFAILMSPWIPPSDAKALDIISITGCSLSLLGLIITIIMHLALWRYVKSDRAVLLMNLCLALIISYAIFLGGVDRTDNKDACTVVAVFLQYIYLVVFFLMLAEGIELAVTILYVFSTRSRLKWLLPLAWVLPAVITAVSVGSSQTEGYGNDKFCWLSIEDGLIWAFVAPAFTIIIINFVLLILVMKAMFNARTLAEKSISVRARTGVRCLCVLLPLMGLTWVIGIFYVNEETVWIQYVFAVCNSLQGLVIFIFHCALNTQIRRGIQRKHKQYTDSMEISKTSTFAIPRINRNSTQFNMIYDLEAEIPPDYDVTDWRRSSQDMPSFQRSNSIDKWRIPRSSVL